MPSLYLPEIHFGWMNKTEFTTGVGIGETERLLGSFENEMVQGRHSATL
jgi:hypothetical protein